MQNIGSNATFRTSRGLNPFVIISFVWISGFIIGLIAALHLSDYSLAAMYNIAFSAFSFSRLFLVLFFPFALSVALIRISGTWLIPLITFFKAVAYGFCSCGIMIAFSSAGWLVRSLLLFSQSIAVLLLLWFWVRMLGNRNSILYVDLLICIILILLVCCIDCFFVSPYLLTLLNM